ncbi:sister chromatid cohesion 1 protein 3-like [Dioscorea cayenensis subsp. rotundata]|uniref:Sister chromatid cohesion 1 protein 3-like n=1 Tax=Dioscorea cayennensis subsp. rotundata TaxID=55577 RepID=A0AB40C1R3_DIOCR|nr:sister chromatid cohesion 1 protein 3-like [Dioscorea cayenensis subsp. rotundata]XP_039133124.1 sister chromatid cohesion 1 protein 3-like [Dioscorea cayenensis subsp. rotundata]XP_039133125.1 sister chromatid cohesion 1 protein 3-like [Dioscorea cayenensis subsp. rotundata]XP_039133126.1 sister chromatid cohesion 1 protein 3-like [Dioscorea cayenensis subsp. rotundata]
MSESNALFTRKGPLGNIWMAAYFFRQLKKKQIASTDISSSIDKILPDAEIPYRILTLLLLGAAKIYAKKVELLYKDCNEALTKINKASINELLLLPDEVTGTSQRKVSEKGKASVSLETTPPLAGAICEPYHGASIIIPERFELDSFDLGIPEDGDTSHSDYNIEDAWTADRSPCTSLHECYHTEATHAGLISGLTLSDDVLPPCVMDINEEISKIYKPDDSVAGGEEFGGDSDHAEDCNDHEDMLAGDILDSSLFNMETGNQEHSDNLDEIISKIIQNNLHDDQPEIHGKSVCLFETETSVSERDIAPEGPTEDTPVETQANIIRGKDPVITLANKERFQLLRKKNYFFDKISVLSDNSQFGMSNLRRNRKIISYARLDVWKACRSANVKQGFLQPLLTGMSPELKALYKDKLTNPFSLKRSSEFVNEQAKQSQHGTETIDLQDVDGLIDLKDITEPVDTLNLAGHVDQFNVAEPVDTMNLAGPVDEINVAEPVDLQNVSEPVNLQNVVEPVNMQIDTHDNPLENILTQEQSHMDILTAETPSTSTDMELYDMEATSTESSSSDFELDAMDGDQDSDGGYSNQQEEDNDDGLSDKTKEVAHLLHKKLASNGEGQEKKTLNLSSVLRDGTRAMSAKFFYETLALKSLGCIDTTQESPYGDIVVSATPQLEKIMDRC